MWQLYSLDQHLHVPVKIISHMSDDKHYINHIIIISQVIIQKLRSIKPTEKSQPII